VATGVLTELRALVPTLGATAANRHLRPESQTGLALRECISSALNQNEMRKDKWRDRSSQASRE